VNLGLSHKTKVTMPTHYKKVSSIMVHFWHSISISITDTFRVYQYHKPLIHDCDTFTRIQNSIGKVCN